MIKASVIEYIKQTYHPRALFLYGSYARGDADECSDFDCLIVVDEKTARHDDRVVEGVPLDLFIYTAEEARTESPDVFLPLFHSELMIDDGTGKALYQRVADYVHEHERIDAAEKEFIAAWMNKTITRMHKGDDEGHHRAVSLLGESLADYYQLRDMFFFGSKQAIAYLRQNDAAGYALFHRAITEKSRDAIEDWARHVMTY